MERTHRGINNHLNQGSYQVCGIATIAIGRKRRGRIPYPLVQRLTTELLIELQVRGLDAAGIAIINEVGTRSIVFKKPLRPVRFVDRPKFREAIGALVGPNTNFIMLHTRATTVGDSSDNSNNHPIIAGPVVGVHNGTIFNDDGLSKAFGLEREGTVDSEVIFRLYSRFVDEGWSPKEALTKMSSQLEGAFTGALVDIRHPSRMIMFKNIRSLCINFLPYYDMVVGVSEARFFAAAADRLKLKARGSSVFVEDGTGLMLDLGGENPYITEGIEDFEIPVSKARTRKFTGHGWIEND